MLKLSLDIVDKFIPQSFFKQKLSLPLHFLARFLSILSLIFHHHQPSVSAALACKFAKFHLAFPRDSRRRRHPSLTLSRSLPLREFRNKCSTALAHSAVADFFSCLKTILAAARPSRSPRSGERGTARHASIALTPVSVRQLTGTCSPARGFTTTSCELFFSSLIFSVCENLLEK